MTQKWIKFNWNLYFINSTWNKIIKSYEYVFIYNLKYYCKISYFSISNRKKCYNDYICITLGSIYLLILGSKFDMFKCCQRKLRENVVKLMWYDFIRLDTHILKRIARNMNNLSRKNEKMLLKT